MIAGCGVRVTGCELRGTGYGLRKEGVMNVEYRTRNIEPQK